GVRVRQVQRPRSRTPPAAALPAKAVECAADAARAVADVLGGPGCFLEVDQHALASLRRWHLGEPAQRQLGPLVVLAGDRGGREVVYRDAILAHLVELGVDGGVRPLEEWQQVGWVSRIDVANRMVEGPNAESAAVDHTCPGVAADAQDWLPGHGDTLPAVPISGKRPDLTALGRARMTCGAVAVRRLPGAPRALSSASIR